MRFGIAIALMTLCCCLAGSAQTTHAPRVPTNPRSYLRMLPGYKLYIMGPGWEGEFGGKIWKDKGLVIDFDQDLHSGIPGAAQQELEAQNVVWRAARTVSDGRIYFTYTKAQILYVTVIPYAVHFRAKIVSPEDMAEMMLMVLTFNPKGYDVDPADIQPYPERN